MFLVLIPLSFANGLATGIPIRMRQGSEEADWQVFIPAAWNLWLDVSL